jgi:protein-S-isoprenylcysteine O-methyltransferase Ste14
MAQPQRALRPAIEARTPALLSPPADWGFTHRSLIAVLVLVPATLVSLFSTPAVTHRSSIALAFDLAAWTLFLAGAALRFWATLYIGGRKRDLIVDEGPYSLCRHPLYLAAFLMALSAGLFLQSLAVACAAVITGIAFLMTTVPQEEAALARLHPRGWADYSERVPCVIPSQRSWRTPSRFTVDVRSLSEEAARASRWVLLPLLAQVFSYLRALPWWPHLVHGAW